MWNLSLLTIEIAFRIKNTTHPLTWMIIFEPNLKFVQTKVRRRFLLISNKAEKKKQIHCHCWSPQRKFNWTSHTFSSLDLTNPRFPIDLVQSLVVKENIFLLLLVSRQRSSSSSPTRANATIFGRFLSIDDFFFQAKHFKVMNSMKHDEYFGRNVTNSWDRCCVE